MLKYLLILLFIFSSAQAELLAQRVQVPSQILERHHELLVYTPPSYDFDNQQHYPVLYLMDGDYNFNYVSALIELWSNISPDLPEMIIVGISGYESKYYRKLMTPPWDMNGQESTAGAADQMMKAIIDEIQPAITKSFRINDLSILAGHSMGGLFITYASITNPQAFDYYIAISPSLWWQQQTMKNVVGQLLAKNTPSARLFMSLANEKGMGVHGFLEMFQENRHDKFDLKFKHFPSESHGSVGLPTYEWALKSIFSPYALKDRYFEHSQAVADYAKRLKQHYGETLPVNSSFLRNTCYAYCSNSMEQIEEINTALTKFFPNDVAFFQVLVAKHLIDVEKLKVAEQWLKKAARLSPEYIDLHHAWSLWYEKNNQKDKAEAALKKVLSLLKTQRIRRWHINELGLADRYQH